MEKATIEEIAARAGVAKGTVYLYFPTKEELFRQSIRYALVATLPEAVAPAQESSTRHLRATIAQYWRFLRSPTLRKLHQLVESEQGEFPDLIELYTASVTSRIEQDFRKILEAGIASGEFRDVDPATAARLLTAVAIQSGTWAAQGAPPLPGKSYDAGFSDLTEFFLQAVVSTEAAFAQADGAPTFRGAVNN